MQVKKSTQEMVYPATPSPAGRVLELSNNDQVMPRLHTPLLFFFRENPVGEAPALLKRSLAQTLSLFYPLAGRCRERSDGQLEIVCNDEGAALHEAWVDCGLDSFLPNCDPRPEFALLVPQLQDVVSTNISEIPLLLVQLTHFECGRVCLGVMLHHSACDGFSIAHFLSSWAGLAAESYRAFMRTSSSSIWRQGSGGGGDCAPAGADQLDNIKPHIDRSLLRANNPPKPTAEHPEYGLTGISPNLMPSTWPPSTSRIFHFTPSSIDALRARFSVGSASCATQTSSSSSTSCSNSTSPHATTLAAHYSRFEALAAHLWRGVIHARVLSADTETRLTVAVDGRKRFNPPLPTGYFGNAVFYGYAVCKAGDVVDSPSASSFGVDIVKAAIAKITDAHMRSALDWVATQGSPKAVVPGPYCRPLVDLAISSWWRFPLYECDFGWGRPSHVRVAWWAFEGLIYLLPSPLGPGHVDALVGLQTEHMPKFEEYLNS